MIRHATIMAIVVGSTAAFFACGGRSGTNGNANGNECPEGHERRGPACVGVFDDCRGPTEVSVLGGGCQPAGVTACATGFVSDDQGGCSPVLPDAPCPAGTMEVIGLADCQPVGVTECATGFLSDGQGGCDPILPQDPCPSGTIQRIGETQCQPLGDCGQGTWGNIPADPDTVFVDQTADATGADGTQSNPFPTINQALSVATAGGRIAVAAGEYVEWVLIDRPVQLQGRCAELVTIRGTRHLGQDRPAVQIAADGAGSSLRGLTLTGAAMGLLVVGATGVIVEEVQVAGAGAIGLRVEDRAEAILRRVKVDQATATGVYSSGSSLELQECVVRDTRPNIDGTFGRGIAVQCDAGTGFCGTFAISRSVVAGNREIGVFVSGVDTVIEDSVIRDTLPKQDDDRAGYGIETHCNTLADACGSLLVSGSVVAGNRDMAVFTSGVDTTIRGSVVKNTLPQQRDQTGGLGIAARCHTDVGACGRLVVSDSLLAGNRDISIVTEGVEATIQGSIIRDTLPRETDQEFGRGIESHCDSPVGTCGSLTVSGSLVAGNREVGIVIAGTEMTIQGSVVRDTLPQQSDGKLGRGINVQCDPILARCAGFAVSGSLITGNRDIGIFVEGVDVAIEASVITDTQPDQSDGTSGRGISAQCDPAQDGGCGSLFLSGSYVAGNRELGVAVFGAEAAIEESSIRDTLPQQSDGTIGRGLNAQCDRFAEACGSLTLSRSLVANNSEYGVFLAGTDAAIENCVIRDTQPRQADGEAGRGINAQCHPEVRSCGGLAVSHTLLVGNRELAIATFGVHAVILDSTVRDTLPRESDGRGGRGINAQCDLDLGGCGSLTVTRTLVARSKNMGIFTGGVDTQLTSVAVVDTRPNDIGPWDGIDGQAVSSICDHLPANANCPTFRMTNCLVNSCYSAGVAILGGSGSIRDSAILGVNGRPSDNAFGYGLQVEGLYTSQIPETRFDVLSTQILNATLAGILYVGAGGTVTGSEITGADFTIVVNQGSAVNVGDDNTLSGTFEDEPSWQNMDPSPAPEPLLPGGVF